jgi:hypothetical protein
LTASDDDRQRHGETGEVVKMKAAEAKAMQRRKRKSRKVKDTQNEGDA